MSSTSRDGPRGGQTLRPNDEGLSERESEVFVTGCEGGEQKFERSVDLPEGRRDHPADGRGRASVGGPLKTFFRLVGPGWCLGTSDLAG